MPPQSDDADRALLERARSDPEAFGELFERHFDAVFGYAVRRTRDWDAARDIASEVFLKALKHAWRFRWRGVPVVAWLFGIANNELRMHFRRGRRAHLQLDDVDTGALAAERDAAEAEIEQAEEFARVQAALLTLPAKYQEVIALRYFEGKDITAIAQILGKREGTVKSLLSRGVARLRNQIEPTAL